MIFFLIKSFNQNRLKQRDKEIRRSNRIRENPDINHHQHRWKMWGGSKCRKTITEEEGVVSGLQSQSRSPTKRKVRHRNWAGHVRRQSRPCQRRNPNATGKDSRTRSRRFEFPQRDMPRIKPNHILSRPAMIKNHHTAGRKARFQLSLFLERDERF